MTATATGLDSLPVYERRDIPEEHQHLRTRTELKGQRLKPAEGQRPVALVRVYRRGHGWGEFPLYDPAGATPMRPLSAKQQQAMTDRRTCPKCGEVRGQVVYGECSACTAKAHQERLELAARTCWKCRRVSAAPIRVVVTAGTQDRCTPCWVLYRLQRQVEAERTAVWRRTCPGRGCAEVTATDEEIAAERAARTWLSPRWCPPCAERDARERAERQQAEQEARRKAEEARRRQVSDLVEWARTVLADPDTVVLDTETTGLHDEARIVDLGVLSVTGQPLMDQLLNPGEPIPPDAVAVHGLTDDDVRDAPSFSSIADELATILAGRRVLIYNEAYDVGRLRHELRLHYAQCGHPDPAQAATAWLDTVRFEDVMIPYSDWYGEWSDYWGNYSWQPLYGGDHRALSDCRAVLDRMREMAGSSVDQNG